MHVAKQKFYSVLALVLILWPLWGLATDYSSSSYSVKDPVINAGLGSGSSSNFGLGQSLSQTVIGKSTSSSFQLWSGFQYFFGASANTLTATAGNAQVALTWTAPTTYLGVAVGGYELGVGTVSGSYTFEDVGNVTSYTKTGLTNGSTYYFIVKAETTSGSFIVFSNESSAAPTDGSTPTTGGSGSGSGVIDDAVGPVGKLSLTGFAPANSLVTILRNGQIAGVDQAGGNGFFDITLSRVPVGQHSFVVYAVDGRGYRTPTFNFTQNFTNGVTNTIDVLLAPTTRPSHTVVRQGEDFLLSGYTVPLSLVVVLLNGTTAGTDTSDASGFWEIIIQTPGMALGTHEITVSVTSNGKTSQFNETIEFEISPDRSVPIREDQLPQSPGFCAIADLNCDGRVDLVDFSIMLYYWLTPGGQTGRADLNKSGLVDLVDFSILLHNWTG